MFNRIVLLLSIVALVQGTPNNCWDGNGQSVACVGPICQDPATAALLPIATVCNNELSDATCRLLFPCDPAIPAPTTATTSLVCDQTVPLTTAPANTPPDPDDWPNVRAFACTLPDARDLALQCARQCAMCCETPEYNCEDDDNSPIDCELNKNKCTVSNWTNIMAQYCPQTCGLCTSGTCLDWNPGCGDLAGLCRNVDWVDYMETHCARTCDTCSSTSSSTSSSGSGCTNIASNCAENANLCTNPTYRTLMLQQCCATCSGTSGGSCTDSSPSCGNWVPNGFCSSTFYTTDQKRQFCGRSCNLC